MAFKKQIYINAPVETVFEMASSFKHVKSIMDNVVEVEVLSEGPIQKGTKIKEVREIRGRRAASILRINEYIPNQKYSVRSEHKGIVIEYHYTFTEKKDGTSVEFEGVIHASGIKNLLIRPLFERIIKKEDEDHLERLKEVIEKEHKLTTSNIE